MPQSRSQMKHMNNLCIKLYHKIVAFKKQFGFAPSLRDMCQMLDIDSTSQVRVYLRKLETWGWVQMEEGKGRTLRLTRPTEIEVPAAIQRKASTVSDRLAEAEHVGQWMTIKVNKP